MNFGEFLMNLGRTSEAQAQYEQAVALMPNSVDIQRRLAEAYLKGGKLGDAVERFNAAIIVARANGQIDEVPSLLDSIKKCQARPSRNAR
jgi:Tfp pilus assembly protein PilF